MSVNSCVKIKVEEDYDQVMIEEHLSDASDLSGNTPTASFNIHELPLPKFTTESQQRDSGKQPISSLTQPHKRWNPEGQRGNRSSQSTRGQSSVSLTCSVGMEQEGQSSFDITQEYDGQQLYGEDGSLSKASFGTDQLRTLGEILAYCQVMYGAIQKLDEKFEQLQAKVTNVHLIQLTPEVFPLQKVTSKTPSAPTNPSGVSVDTSSFPDPTLSMPQLVRVCSPPPPPSFEVKRPPALSPAPRLPSPPSLPPQGPNDSLVKSVVAAHLSNHLIPLNKTGDKQIQSQGSNDSLVKSVVTAHLSNHLKAGKKQFPRHSYTIPGASPKTVWLGSRKRNVCISQSALQKAKLMSKPGRAVRFLTRCVFSKEEMSSSNTLGDPTRGLKKLDPNKLSAIREWLARRYPEYDLKEKGKDWRKCMSVMNSTGRYLRLMAKRRRLKMQKQGEETVKQPDVTETHIEPIPETEAELPEDHYAAEIEDPVELENYTNITEMGGPIKEYTAEIDVELSESEEEDNASSKTQTEKEEESSPISCSDVAYEYLGNPERNVKVPQYAMFIALQRTRPELAARVLIKYMFPEEVLVVSNVHGNNESGIRALDHNKISALREHLQERFPWLLLDEDGQDWKVCVGAINSTIRKFRHELKMGRGRKKGT